MTETTVVTRRSRSITPEKSTEFSFAEQNIPERNGNKALLAFRKKAWKAFSSKPLPNTKEEAWRRTDISLLDPAQFSLVKPDAYLDLPAAPDELLIPLADQNQGGQIVLYGANSTITVSPELSRSGVVFTTLEDAQKNHQTLLQKWIGKIVKENEGKFPSLVQALAQDGVFLYVPKGKKVEQPLHSILWGAGTKTAYLSHIIVVLEEGSEVTYIHESASPEDAFEPAMHAGIVEIHVGEEAKLHFVELQSFGKNVWNFSNERARIERNGSIDWIFGAIGSHVTKNFTDLDLVGEGAVGKMSGFYFSNGKQHLDHDTQQNHLAPHTTSDLLFKGALLDESHSVWQGMIYVAPGAAKTDGYQANRNLVLSKNAHADSIPGLEILADDVRCTHGATVGKIDKDEVFYLVSRGIPQKESERLIVEGFFDPIMQRIPFEGVRSRFQQYIHEKMAVNI
jgi:Fe-S cluster assembly protein SufD